MNGIRFSLALALAVALAASYGPAPSYADDPPAEKPGEAVEEVKQSGEEKAAEAKTHAEEAKQAGQEKAAAAKQKTKQKGQEKEKKAKSTTKEKAADARAKGDKLTEGAKAAAGTMPVKPAVEPQHVQVQHILIAFAGSGTKATRTKEEAKKLAYEILERARKGEDFDALVRQYTDDSPPGIYGMSGIGVTPAAGEYARNGMVPAFGNVGFAISPGNIGIADFDPQASPYGWHIIKRLK